MTETIIHLLERNAVSLASKPAYEDKVSGTWQQTDWAEFNRLTRQAAGAMLSLGLGQGDVVTILGNNRPEWTISALAIMRVGGIAAGVYTTNAPDEVAYIVNHAESKLIVLEDESQLEKVEKQRNNLPSLQHIVVMGGAGQAIGDRATGWDDFLALGDAVEEGELDSKLDELRLDQVADFIYTSGTTGPPKAVMLTHENLVWTADALAKAADLTSDEAMVSYLPLSHIAEQLASIHIAITKGYTVTYCHDGLQVTDFISHVRPTAFFGVPRVWERFYSGVSAQLNEATGAKAAIVSWARGVGRKVTAERVQGREPSGLLAVQSHLADRLVFAKLREALGLNRTRRFISGAAPISAEILDFFASLGIQILEIYGQSEGSGPTTTNTADATRFGTVGQRIDGIEVKISDDGEILFKGKNVFAGYFKDEAATAETLVDGWLHSGDLGQFDDDGYLTITGRSKDIIITSGGKNVAPKNLEGALTALELVGQAVCVGEQQRYLVALLTLQPEAADRFATENGIDRADLATHPALRNRLEQDITQDVNSQFARVEHIRNFAIIDHEFSVETGELTPTFKIKRAMVNEKYAESIQQVYEAGQVI